MNTYNSINDNKQQNHELLWYDADWPSPLAAGISKEAQNTRGHHRLTVNTKTDLTVHHIDCAYSLHTD